MRKPANSWRTRVLGVVALVALAWALVPGQALALTTSKATARPNESGGSSVIGGLATRLTWEGTVDAGEQVSSVTLKLPEGSSFEGAKTTVTALQGLKRMEVVAEAKAQGPELQVSFAEPLGEGLLLRLEIEGMSFPAAGGEVVVGGRYVSQAGEQALADAKPITTIANTPVQMLVSRLDASPFVAAWNANPFLGMFAKPQLLVTAFASLVPGWLLCLLIVVIAYPFAIVLGLIFAFMKLSRYRIVRAIAICYINVLRGTPLFLQIYIMFFGLPMMNISIDNNVLGVIVIAINASSYLAEIFRAGIESIPVGQYEAASSLGMSYFQTMFSIILPQTIRRVMPTVTSDFITSYKDTSLLSSVGVMELMMFSKNLTSVTGNMTPYVAAAIFYLIVTLPLIKAVSTVEKRMANAERGGGKRPRGKVAKPAEAGGEVAAATIEPEGAQASAQAVEDRREPSGLQALLAPFAPHVSSEV